MITILTSVVCPLSAEDGRESGEGLECKLYIIVIQFRDFTWYSVASKSIHCYHAMLHNSIGIWYWALVSLEANIIGYWVPCLVSF